MNKPFEPYAKLFSSILQSSLWTQAPIATRVVWITILAMKDANGFVMASIPGIAHSACVSLAEAEAAIEYLMAPDKYSRSKEHDGRRLLPVDGGWQVVNALKYRDKMRADNRREYMRVYMAEKRRAKLHGKPLKNEVEAIRALEAGDTEAYDKLVEPPL